MKKKVAINIGEICDAMENNSLEIRRFLNLETGEVITVSDFGNEFDDENVSDKIDEEPECYKPIPFISSWEAYQNMENFIYTVIDEKLKGELNRAINGKGAFRRFKDVLIEIALLGSLATSKKRIAKDIDLMVFTENTDCIDKLAMCHRKVLGKFHSSPDVFVFTKDRQFLGNVCHRRECPSQSVDCQVHGCGEIKYIEKRQGFTFNERNIFKNKPRVLWLNPRYEASISDGWFNRLQEDLRLKENKSL